MQMPESRRWREEEIICSIEWTNAVQVRNATLIYVQGRVCPGLTSAVSMGSCPISTYSRAFPSPSISIADDNGFTNLLLPI
jgi:hypothetical protein